MASEIPIESWKSFSDFLTKMDIQDDRLFVAFRGQAKNSWSLKPSLTRFFSPNLTREKAHGIENGLMRDFQFTARPLFVKDSSFHHDWPEAAWWALMQHHSFATRLLDWTMSPYIALYFACAEHLEDEGAVYFFPMSQLEARSEQEYPGSDFYNEDFLRSGTRAIKPIFTAASDRSAAQQGCFTLSADIFADHGDLIEELLEKDKWPCHLRVPSHLKIEFLARLRLMNITPSALFPGIDGVGRAAVDRVRIRVGLPLGVQK